MGGDGGENESGAARRRTSGGRSREHRLRLSRALVGTDARARLHRELASARDPDALRKVLLKWKEPTKMFARKFDPYLRLLEGLGKRRTEVYTVMYEAAKNAIKARAATASEDALAQALDLSLPLLECSSTSSLLEIPFTVMSAMKARPAEAVAKLGEMMREGVRAQRQREEGSDMEHQVAGKIPPEWRRTIWEDDRASFRAFLDIELDTMLRSVQLHGVILNPEDILIENQSAVLLEKHSSVDKLVEMVLGSPGLVRSLLDHLIYGFVDGGCATFCNIYFQVLAELMDDAKNVHDAAHGPEPVLPGLLRFVSSDAQDCMTLFLGEFASNSPGISDAGTVHNAYELLCNATPDSAKDLLMVLCSLPVSCMLAASIAGTILDLAEANFDGDLEKETLLIRMWTLLTASTGAHQLCETGFDARQVNAIALSDRNLKCLYFLLDIMQEHQALERCVLNHADPEMERDLELIDGPLRKFTHSNPAFCRVFVAYAVILYNEQKELYLNHIRDGLLVLVEVLIQNEITRNPANDFREVSIARLLLSHCDHIEPPTEMGT